MKLLSSVWRQIEASVHVEGADVGVWRSAERSQLGATPALHLLAWFLVSTAQPPGCHTHTCAHTRALCVAIHYLHSSGKILEKIRIWIICRAGRFIFETSRLFFFLPKIKLIKVKSSSCCHIQYPSIRLPGGFSRFRMCTCSTFPIRARTPASIFQSQRRVFGSRL